LGEPAPTDEGESAAGMGVAAGPWLDAGGRLEEVGGTDHNRNVPVSSIICLDFFLK
jgi:hypothetical protein